MGGIELTLQDVAEHNTKKDCYMVIHDNIYDVTKFVDEHPGGEEVMLDVAGQDASEEFEDIGHSDEAREQLEALKIGALKKIVGDPVPSKHAAPPKSNSAPKADNTGLGIGLYAALVVGGAVAYGAYVYLQQQQQQS